MDQAALVIARALEAYLALGLPFAIAFAVRGVGVVDPEAKASTRGFRLLVVPGAVALWPLLLRRWLAATARPTERNAHRDAAREGASP